MASAAILVACGYGVLIARSADAQTADANGTAAASLEPAAATADEQIPTKSAIDMFFAGGVLMYPILASSFVLLLFTFERLVALRRGHVIPRPFVRRFLQQLGDDQLEPGEALVLCEENGSHVAKVFAAAVRKWGKPAVEVEQAIIDAGERVTNDLRKYLRIINGVSTVCPLFGLLGTVTGMIAAFNTIATVAAMGHPELLAAGISEALLTTAFGLFVAIPALIIYLYFVGRVDRHIIEIDALGQQVVDIISAEALSGERPDRGVRHSKKNKAA
ncbi:MAG: MotA/TolQ/ExbB proton channel family protein [Planctomycetota bacterium]|nr:MAG: MotA/TolQ/ExbB proton channel family protein [Planctomycetota bacterium]